MAANQMASGYIIDAGIRLAVEAGGERGDVGAEVRWNGVNCAAGL
jgi:hypothetical protein